MGSFTTADRSEQWGHSQQLTGQNNGVIHNSWQVRTLGSFTTAGRPEHWGHSQQLAEQNNGSFTAAGRSEQWVIHSR